MVPHPCEPKGDRARILEVKGKGALVREESELNVYVCAHNTHVRWRIDRCNVSPFEYLKRD